MNAVSRALSEAKIRRAEATTVADPIRRTRQADPLGGPGAKTGRRRGLLESPFRPWAGYRTRSPRLGRLALP
jgi:hypothetical protein